METEKLYYHDPFLKTFTATVLACTPMSDAWQVVLDRTAFYPEGGGQPADHGLLGQVRVLDVHEKGGEIFHICDKPVETGALVAGQLDWARRFDHMQQHSGEHILSGILCSDYHCDNVGFHLGADTVTIDYNADLTWEQVLAAEDKANAVIWANQAAEITYPASKALEALDYRSKKALAGSVRIVTFPGADCCACCGTHVLQAGQVGLVKVLSCQKFREGVRLEILCGGRAMSHFKMIHEQNRQIATSLSVKPGATKNAVARLQTELQAAKAYSAHLEGTVFSSIAASCQAAGDVLLLQPPMTPDAVRRLADAVALRCGGLAAVFAGEGGKGHVCKYNYALVRSDGAEISPLVKNLNAALHGKGGGRNGFAQGSVETRQEDIQRFFHKEE